MLCWDGARLVQSCLKLNANFSIHFLVGRSWNICLLACKMLVYSSRGQPHQEGSSAHQCYLCQLQKTFRTHYVRLWLFDGSTFPALAQLHSDKVKPRSHSKQNPTIPASRALHFVPVYFPFKVHHHDGLYFLDFWLQRLWGQACLPVAQWVTTKPELVMSSGEEELQTHTTGLYLQIVHELRQKHKYMYNLHGAPVHLTSW